MRLSPDETYNKKYCVKFPLLLLNITWEISEKELNWGGVKCGKQYYYYQTQKQLFQLLKQYFSYCLCRAFQSSKNKTKILFYKHINNIWFYDEYFFK